ncbi:MAG: type VI secretion system tube protein Hcp [Pseudomonadota bacterium]|nr:type VI secretion system tube protein Hcp [Pseudomonadota bacterium]
MASDIFLKIDGIKGEATEVNHLNEIEVVSWSWGVSEVFITSGAGGIIGGKPKVGDFVIGKQIDRASPNLLRACLTAKHIKEVVLTQRRVGTKPNFLSITLKDVLISSLNDSDSGVAPRPTESVVFAFGKVIYEYVPQKPNGQPDTPVTLKWDVKASKEF